MDDEVAVSNHRDYSGVPTSELAAVYAEYKDTNDFAIFADRIGMDERDLKKVLVTQLYPFTGLRVADKILMGIGQNLSALVLAEELHIVPARDSMSTAMKMVEDEISCNTCERLADPEGPCPTCQGTGIEPGREMTKAQKQDRAHELVVLRRELCYPSPAEVA